jgi:hypothetical protein
MKFIFEMYFGTRSTVLFNDVAPNEIPFSCTSSSAFQSREFCHFRARSIFTEFLGERYTNDRALASIVRTAGGF